MDTLNTMVRSKSQRRSRYMNPTIVSFILLICAVISVASWKASEAGWVEYRVFQWIGRPAMLVHRASLVVSNTIVSIPNHIRASKTLPEVQKQAEALSYEVQLLRAQVKEVDRLRKLLNLPSQSPFQTVPALVINRASRLGRILIINRGSADGLQMNQPVISPEGLIGRTERVLTHTCRVMLLNDPGSSVGVKIVGKNYEGLVQGRMNEDRLILNHIMQNTGFGQVAGQPVEIGDTLITSGIGMTFPQGLLVGTIHEKIDESEEGDFWVNPIYQESSLTEVLVIINNERSEEFHLMTDESYPTPLLSPSVIPDETAEYHDGSDESQPQETEIVPNDTVLQSTTIPYAPSPSISSSPEQVNQTDQVSESIQSRGDNSRERVILPPDIMTRGGQGAAGVRIDAAT